MPKHILLDVIRDKAGKLVRVALGQASEYKKPACKTGFPARCCGKYGVDGLLLCITYETTGIDGKDIHRAVFPFGYDFV